jgi:hypothetical protein
MLTPFTSPKSLFSCNSRPDALPPKPESETTVFGPAQITISTWNKGGWGAARAARRRLREARRALRVAAVPASPVPR